MSEYGLIEGKKKTCPIGHECNSVEVSSINLPFIFKFNPTEVIGSTTVHVLIANLTV